MFLKRNLIFNKKKTQAEIFYVHFTTTIDEFSFDFIRFIKAFLQEESCEKVDEKAFTQVDLKNYSHAGEYKTSSFSLSFFGCLLCKHSYESLNALQIHLSLCHFKFESSLLVIYNPYL